MIACGGEGTVRTVVELVATLFNNPTIVVIFRMGMGNDLGNALGWPDVNRVLRWSSVKSFHFSSFPSS